MFFIKLHNVVSAAPTFLVRSYFCDTFLNILKVSPIIHSVNKLSSSIYAFKHSDYLIIVGDNILY